MINISMDPPRYETKLVTLPVVTQARRRSLPNRLGPWPIKRSRSEAGWDSSPDTHSTDEPTERLDLKTVLTRLDEECAAIDKVLLNQDADGNTIVASTASTIQDEEKHNDTREKPSTSKATGTLLGALLALSFAGVFISAPLLTFVFAGGEQGRIILPSQAPSKTAFAAMLAVPITLIGFVFALATMEFLYLRNNWNLFRRRRHLVLLVLLGGFWGAFLDMWVLVWLMPLVRHA
jgi:hypothetical protein